jgi:hypothetical protein
LSLPVVATVWRWWLCSTNRLEDATSRGGGYLRRNADGDTVEGLWKLSGSGRGGVVAGHLGGAQFCVHLPWCSIPTKMMPAPSAAGLDRGARQRLLATMITRKGKSYRLRERGTGVAPAAQPPSLRDPA